MGGPKEAGVGEAEGCHSDPVRWTAKHVRDTAVRSASNPVQGGAPVGWRAAQDTKSEGLGPEQTLLLLLLHGMAQHTLEPPPGWSADANPAKGPTIGLRVQGQRRVVRSSPRPPRRRAQQLKQHGRGANRNPEWAQEPARPSAHTVVPGKGPLLPVWG